MKTKIKKATFEYKIVNHVSNKSFNDYHMKYEGINFETESIRLTL